MQDPNFYTLYEKTINSNYQWQKMYNFMALFGANIINKAQTYIYSMVIKMINSCIVETFIAKKTLTKCYILFIFRIQFTYKTNLFYKIITYIIKIIRKIKWMNEFLEQLVRVLTNAFSRSQRMFCERVSPGPANQRSFPGLPCCWGQITNKATSPDPSVWLCSVSLPISVFFTHSLRDVLRGKSNIFNC